MLLMILPLLMPRFFAIRHAAADAFDVIFRRFRFLSFADTPFRFSSPSDADIFAIFFRYATLSP